MRKGCKQFLYLPIVVIFCFSSKTVSAQVRNIDIKKAIDIALASNYTLRADSLNIRMADFKNKQIAGAYLPQVSYGSKLNYNPAIPTQMLPGTVVGQPSKEYVPIQFGTKYDASSTLEVNQTVYRKDLLLQIRAADLYSGIARTRHQLTKEDIVYQVATGFYSLQSKVEIIRTTNKDYLNLRDILTIAKTQFENGTLKRIDFESLQINVANKKSELAQLITQYNEQLDFFKYLLGIPVSDSISISDTISYQSPLVKSNTAGLSNREDIQLYRQLMKAKEVDIKSIRAENQPSISTYFRYGYQSQFSSSGKMFNNDYWFKSSSIGLTVSVSLFDGYRRRNRTNIAQAELQQLKLQTEQKEQKAQTEWQSAWDKLTNNRRQFYVNTENLALAEKVFHSRKALYTEGVTSLIELLDAERELSQARNLHMQSMINIQTGQLDVHKANGTLLTDFLNTL